MKCTWDVSTILAIAVPARRVALALNTGMTSKFAIAAETEKAGTAIRESTTQTTIHQGRKGRTLIMEDFASVTKH